MSTVKKVVGKIPVGRGAYSASNRYYKENTVTLYGMSFRALSDMEAGFAPATINSAGSVVLTNTDKWQLLSGTPEAYQQTSDIQNLNKKFIELESNINKTSTISLGSSKELNDYNDYQKRVYFYGNYKKGEKISVKITGTAILNEGSIAVRPDDDSTNFAILSMGSEEEFEITQDTTYIVVLLNNNNIITNGTIICNIVGITETVETLTLHINEVENKTTTNKNDIIYLKDIETKSFKFRSSTDDVLNDSLEVGVYTIQPTASNLPTDHLKNVYSWLIVYHKNFRLLYSQDNQIWWTIDNKWRKIASEIDRLSQSNIIDNILKTLNGQVINEENIIGEELLLDKYVNVDTAKVNTYSDNNLAIAPFPIKSGLVYEISVAKTTNSAGLILCYAETLNSLQCIPILNTVGNRDVFNYTYTADKDGYLFIGISADSKYITVKEVTVEKSLILDINLLKILTQSLSDEVNKLKSLSIDWSSKKWVVIGDSLSTNNTTTSKRYIDYIVEKTGIQVEVLAVGGSSWGKPQLQDNAFFQQAGRVASDADIVTIFGSFNSWYLKDEEGNVTDGPTSPGDLGSEDVSTRYGCMNMVFKNIYANAPLARVGVIYPTPWKTANPYSPTETTNSLMEMLDNVTKKWGVPKLDLFHESGMRPWEEEYRLLVYSKDSGGIDGNPAGVHPNEVGHEIIAAQVLEFMKRII